MSETLAIDVAKAFRPLLDTARYKGAYGGRGSGKSQFFADLMVATAIRKPGFRGLCCREVQKSLKESAKRLIESKIQAHKVGGLFDVQEAQIKTPGGGVIVFAGLQDHTSESIKSYEGFDVAWVEEAQTVSERSLNLLRPTIRSPGSELWFSWNPRHKQDAVDKMLRGDELPTNAHVVRANWDANPWFPAELEQERQDCLRQQPDQYAHIWEGDYVTVSEGAYFARDLAKAREEGRITDLALDPVQQIKAFWDIGVRDATAIWIGQFSGQTIKLLDYYEAVGQPLGAHLAWLRSRGYGSALCVLPHDGAKADAVSAVRFEDHIRQAGFEVQTVENQGKGAAMKRVEAARRLFPRIWFDAKKCEGGLQALGWYHEKRDDQRNIGLGPEHDWSSHCFTGDTLVSTDQGLVRFDELPPTGLVSTPCGMRPYRSPRMTRANAPLVEVKFSDGSTVKCTPDHLFATGSGWKSAQSLVRGSLILSTSTPLRSILTAACIGLGQMKSISAEVASGFIAMFGRMLSGQSRKAATSTTKTGILSTTSSTTLSAWMRASTSALHGTRAVKPIRPSIFQPWRGIVPETGTSQKKAAYGTSAMPHALSFGQRTNGQSEPAKNAARCLWAWIALRPQPRSTVRPPVNGKPIVSRVKQALMPLRIVSVRQLSQKADVWDLTVPGVECFSLGNGAVVHNCADAFGLMCVAYEAPRGTPAKLDYSRIRRGIA